MPSSTAIDNTGATDISDVRTDAGSNGAVVLSPTVLPIRGEKRIIPVAVNPQDATAAFEQDWKKSGQPSPMDKGYAPTGRTALISTQDYYLKAAMGPYVDYVYIRLLHRGIGTDKSADGKNLPPAVYRFLINPSQVSINRNTLDAQVMTRAGWQIGVWGEDSVRVTLNGKTAGQYWSFGITDRYQPFTESYRNLLMLQMVFENNGYFFEGESQGAGPLAADWTRRRIKLHQDVELIVGNFVWYGMFETLTVSQSAEEPWLASFSLGFTAWKERFRTGSPYQNLIRSDVERGHSYGSWIYTVPSSANGVPSNTNNTQMVPPQTPIAVSFPVLPNTPLPTPPAPSPSLPNPVILPLPPPAQQPVSPVVTSNTQTNSTAAILYDPGNYSSSPSPTTENYNTIFYPAPA